MIIFRRTHAAAASTFTRLQFSRSLYARFNLRSERKFPLIIELHRRSVLCREINYSSCDNRHSRKSRQFIAASYQAAAHMFCPQRESASVTIGLSHRTLFVYAR